MCKRRQLIGLNIKTQLIFLYTEPLTRPREETHTAKIHPHAETSYFIPLPLAHPPCARVFCSGCNYCLNGGVQKGRIAALYWQRRFFIISIMSSWLARSCPEAPLNGIYTNSILTWYQAAKTCSICNKNWLLLCANAAFACTQWL